MANELKTRIVLEGEKEYARAMSDAARQMKALNAEEKLAQAQFRATGNAEAHAAEQSRILREQIALQQQAVQAAEKAVAALTQQGVQPNDAAMTKWRTKLANARTALVQLQARLDSVEDDLREDTRGFESAGDAARDYGDDLRKIGGTINTQAAVDSIGKITGAIEGTLRMAARATRAVVGIATDAGQWADEVKTAADQMEIDPETYQSWEYAATFIDTDMADISKSWQDIGRKLKDGNNDFAVSLDQMGIATRDAGGNLRTTNAVFWDAIDYLHQIDDQSLRAAKATELFGNDWRKLNPLIQAGSGAFQDMAKEGLDVAAVSNAQVNALGTMNDAIESTELQFRKLKMDAVAALAPSFERIAKALAQAIQSLDEFVQSAEGQEALQALGGALESIINKFTEVDENGENGFQRLVNKAAEAIGGLTEGLKWISANSGTVVTGLAMIGGILGTLTVAKGVLDFLQLMQTAQLGGIGKLFGKGGTGSGTGGTGTTLVPYGGTGTTGTTVMSPNGTPTLLTKAGLVGLAAQLWEQGPEGQLARHTQETYGHSVMTGSEAAQELTAMMQSMGDAQVQQAEKAGEDTGKGYATGLVNSRSVVEAAATNIAGGPLHIIKAMLEIHSPSKVMEGLGQMAGMGFAQGLLSSSGAVAAAAAALGAIASRIPVGGAAGVGAFAAGAMAGASFSSSFFIDKYIQNSGEDARALAARVQDVNGWTRAGFGHRG